MMRGVLAGGSGNPDLFRWCGGSGEMSLSRLPGRADLQDTVLLHDYDFCIVHGSSDGDDGIGTVREIRTANPLTPVVFLTDQPDAGLGAAALGAGADYYLWGMDGESSRTLLAAVVTNLVRQRREEARMIEDSSIMRTIHDTSPIAACVVRDHRIAWLNAFIPRKLGYTGDELLGLDSALLFPDEAEYNRVLAGLSEGPGEGGWCMVEARVKRKDGTLLDCHLLSRPADPADPARGQIIIGQDISDYLRMRDLLRKSEVRYQDLLDSAHSIVLRLDTRGTIRFVNKFGAAFFGFTPEELTGKRIIGTIVPRVSSTGRDLGLMIRDVMENPEEFEVNVNENMKRNGERVWVAWTNRAIRDDHGRLTGVLSIGHDITERKITHGDLSLDSASWVSTFLEGTDIREEVFEDVYSLALELSREGREGKQIGTAFMVGSAPDVLAGSTQLILNPFEGHRRSARNITNHEIRETVKELSQIDGAFVIAGDGTIEAAGRYITIDTSQASVPKGLGTRHASVAGITREVHAVGIVISQSGGKISLFKDGEIFRIITVKE